MSFSLLKLEEFIVLGFMWLNSTKGVCQSIHESCAQCMYIVVRYTRVVFKSCESAERERDRETERKSDNSDE